MRDVSSAAAAQIDAESTRMAVFVQAAFVTETCYVWSGYGPITTPAGITLPAHTWQGVGKLGSVSTITEDSTLTAQGMTIGLSGIDPEIMADCLNEVQQGLPVKVWLVFFTGSTYPEGGDYVPAGTVIDGVLCFAGRMDQPTFDEGRNSCTITIAVENRLSDLQRSPQRRYTDQDQRQRFPDDNGLRLMAQSYDWNACWGGGG